MASLKEQLSVKGTKVKLQFSTKEREYFEREAGFTDEELEVFRFRTRGFNTVQIATHMEELFGKYYSVSTIESRIKSIKRKIYHLL